MGQQNNYRKRNKARNAIPWRIRALALLMSDMLAKWLPPCLAALKIGLAEHAGTHTVAHKCTHKHGCIYIHRDVMVQKQLVPQFHIGSNASCCLSFFIKKYCIKKAKFT